MASDLEKIRHSAAHILVEAVLILYPKVKLGIGPAIEDGFYYDFDNLKITEEDLKKIEEKMSEIIKKNSKFEKSSKTKSEAKKLLSNQHYKLELLDDIKEPTFYQSGNFMDLCEGPHVNSTGEIKAFKLMKIAGAYWKGDSKNKMLTRIYGTAFPDKNQLNQYLKQLEEAEKRNHIKLGKELEKLGKEIELKAGYGRVTTPVLAKKELFIKSGHLPYYKDSMYPSMKMDDGEYYLRAMNCPHHHLIFKNKLVSYRDLPIKLAEYGLVYRNELSGTLAGLLRVRGMTQNDAHIYCMKSQIEEEFENVLKMVQEYLKIFKLENYWFRLSKWDPKNKEKYINEPKNWEYSQDILRKVLKKLKVTFTEADDEAAFYGPKVDVQFKAVSGREETMSTIQLDFAAKERFELT